MVGNIWIILSVLEDDLTSTLLIASWHETSKAGRCYGLSVTEWRTLFQGSDSSSSIPFSDVASSYAQGKRWVIGMKEEYEARMYEIQNILIRFSWYIQQLILYFTVQLRLNPRTLGVCVRGVFRLSCWRCVRDNIISTFSRIDHLWIFNFIKIQSKWCFIIVINIYWHRSGRWQDRKQSVNPSRDHISSFCDEKALHTVDGLYWVPGVLAGSLTGQTIPTIYLHNSLHFEHKNLNIFGTYC